MRLESLKREEDFAASINEKFVRGSEEDLQLLERGRGVKEYMRSYKL